MELPLQRTSEVSQISDLVNRGSLDGVKAPQITCQRGMAGLGEFARKSPWGRIHGQCWLQSSGTALCQLPAPAPGTARAQQEQTLGTAAEQQKQQPNM